MEVRNDTAGSAHPAFVSMILQLTQDEAWILKSINKTEYPLIRVHTYEPNIKKSHGFRSLLGIELGIGTRRFQQYISNLQRLGILDVVGSMMLEREPYTQLAQAVE